MACWSCEDDDDDDEGDSPFIAWLSEAVVDVVSTEKVAVVDGCGVSERG